MTYLAAFVVLALGIAGMVAGEADDSPGLQFIGLILIVGAVTLTVKSARRRRARS